MTFPDMETKKLAGAFRAGASPKCAKTPLQGSVGILPAFLWFALFREAPFRALRAASLSALTVCLAAGCEGRDVSLQKELAELREKARLAEEELSQTTREKNAAEENLSRVQLRSSEALRSSFEQSRRRLEQDLNASFPGYRPEAITTGRLAYVYENGEPYRLLLEIKMQPTTSSALTPEVPPLVFEAKATPDGIWKTPTQAALREMLAATSAQAASQSRAPSRSQDSPALPKPSSPGARAINGPSSAPAQQPPIPTGVPSGNTPRASESYEIRFND